MNSKQLQELNNIDKDEFEERIQEMNDEQLAEEIMEHPEMAEYIVPFVDDLSAFYDIIAENYIPDCYVVSDEEARLNRWIPKILGEIKDYLHNGLNCYSFEEYEQDRYKRKKHEVFMEILDEEIGYGATPEYLIEYCEEKGYHLDEIYDVASLSERYKYWRITDYDEATIAKAFESKRQARLEDELEKFFEEHPDMDDRPDSQIPEGMRPEEYSEAMGISINEFEEIIRNQKTKLTPLQQKEAELSALEAKEKKILEEEALMNKQKQKEGQDIGE